MSAQILRQKEERLINEMIQAMKKSLHRRYKPGKTRRDAHPKSPGLITIRFEVLADIAPEFAIGIFQPGALYEGLARFSNASAEIQNDRKKDLRGLAIKLVEIKGARISQHQQQTQDFLLMSHPTMPLGTVKDFRDAVVTASSFGKLAVPVLFLATGRLKILRRLTAAKSQPANLLDIPYWSTTPYRLGKYLAVKYHIRPVHPSKDDGVNRNQANYLSAALDHRLGASSAKFDFFVQKFVSEELTPIEDASVEWPESQSPFIKLAEIEVPIQRVGSPQRKQLAEQLSFAVSNSLKAHEPIGGLNRARTKIYETMSMFRANRDNFAPVEPDENLIHDL